LNPYVLDASVTLSWALPDQMNARTRQLLAQCQAAYVEVPALWPTEVANGLLVAERRSRLLLGKADLFLQKLANLDVRIASPRLEQRSILELARQENLTVYDASYLALSISTGLPLATLDSALARAARKLGLAVLPSEA
jgi:predicted nucleic acid-binding protein